jgi:hypothetical protein
MWKAMAFEINCLQELANSSGIPAEKSSNHSAV